MIRTAEKKVLVTGASGFLAAHLIDSLVATGAEVTCLVRRSSQIDHLRGLPVRLAYGDVTDRESVASAMRGADHVYHLAGVTKTLHADEFRRVNAEGTGNVAEVCAEQPRPPVLVVVSSLAAAGPSRVDRPNQESDVAHPVSHYGRSKLAGEMAAWRLADKVPITVVRPPIVFGPHGRDFLSLFKSVRQMGFMPAPGMKRARHSLIHAADLTSMFRLAAESGERLPPFDPGREPDGKGYYYVAAESDPFYDEYLRWIGHTIGRRHVLVLPVIKPLATAIAAASDLIGHIVGKPMPLNLDKIAEATAGSWTCSAEKARRQLGFAPSAPLEQRLAQTADWFRQAGWL